MSERIDILADMTALELQIAGNLALNMVDTNRGLTIGHRTVMTLDRSVRIQIHALLAVLASTMYGAATCRVAELLDTQHTIALHIAGHVEKISAVLAEKEART